MQAKLILKPGKEKSLLKFHPWVFSGAVAQAPAKTLNGEIVQVFSQQGQALGLGFWDPTSQIQCRLFSFAGLEKSVLPTDINREYWKAKLEAAKHLRQQLIQLEHTNCYRLIHGEGDFWPGMIADIYHDVVSIQYTLEGTWKLREIFHGLFLEMGFKTVVGRYLPQGQKSAQTEVSGAPLQGLVRTIENDLHFNVDVLHGQKTGMFLDQRDNRAWVEHYSKNRTVLNAFCFNGGFSLYALKGGARHVDSVDIAKQAISDTNGNVALNFGENTPHQGIAADCFQFLREMPHDHYDLIVLDPPAFAKNNAAVQQATRGYKDINLLAFKKCKANSFVFTFSCSQKIDADLFQKIIFGASADSGRKVRIVRHFTQGGDHPTNIYHPEGFYLKGLLCYVE